MRKIKIETWKSPIMVKDADGKPTGETKEVDENLLIAFNMLVGNKKPEEMPRGIEKFRIMGNLAKAFDKADKTSMLELEDREYKFLKETIEKDVPSFWGMNQKLSVAINDFLDAKDE